MIIRESATIDIRRRDTGDIAGAHPVIDCLMFHVITAGDRGFQIDNAYIGLSTGQLGQRNASDRGKINQLWNRPAKSALTQLLFRCDSSSLKAASCDNPR